MARSQRQVPSVYFGRPGSLVTLPWPRGDMDAPYERLTFDFLTGQGQHQVSSLTGGSRSFSLKWNALSADTFAAVEAFRVGTNGRGPWVLIDPSRMNLFEANVSGATGLYNDARQFKTFTGAANEGSLSSNQDTTYVHRAGARRSLRWLFGVAAATVPVLTVTPPYRNWFGTPAVPGLSYAFSSWVRPDNVVDSSITVGLRLRWLNAAGAQISESTGGDSALAAWTRLTCIATAPALTAYVEPRWVVTGSTVTTGGSVYIDEPLLEQDSVVNDWAAGTGVRPVEILSLPETVPFEARFRTGTVLDLRELSA